MEVDLAQKIIEDVFKLLGAPAESVSYTLDDKRGHVFRIKSLEFEKMSSERADLSRDVVYLFKRIFNRTALPGTETFKCTIDINDEQSKADSKIKMKALNAAEEARNLKTDVLMEPMSSYERMVVHSTLAGGADISTESVGEGRERRVKIRYLSI